MKEQEKHPNFETAKLSEFVFGDPEAKSDEILEECFQKIQGVEEFLSGSKNIVLGERGAGKSALFKLVANGTLQFRHDSNEKRKLLIVPIDDDLEYLSIANIIEERFSDQTKRRYGKHRYLWELYILSRIIDRLQEEYPEDPAVHALREDFGAVLGLPKDKNFRMRDLFTAYKFTLGSKFEQTGTVTPTVSIEPAKDADKAVTFVTDREINLLKDRLKKELKSKESVAIVLVDRVDDFVVGMAYEEQLRHIQALVDCIKDFRLPEMKLKIFLRTDLFNRIGFEHGGFDKLTPQICQLEWCPEDICEFVARRLIYNYNRLNIKVSLKDFDLSLLDVDPAFAEQLDNVSRAKVESISGFFGALYKIVIVGTKIKWARFMKKSHSARHTDLLHAIILRFITLIFPTRVSHFNNKCVKENIPLEEFFSTHFKFGGDNPNPRLVLLFLGFTFQKSTYYYSRNPDKASLPANHLNEFELILNEHIMDGYRKLQETARHTVSHLNSDFRKYVGRLFANVDKPKNCCRLKLEQLKQFTEWDLPDEEFRRFMAFFTHIGLLVPDNPTAQFEKRTYSLPLLMRMCLE